MLAIQRSRLIFATIIAAFCTAQLQAQDFVPTKYFEATFKIRAGDQDGTTFLIAYKEAPYLVTARHLFKQPKNNQTISFKILKDSVWINEAGILLISDTVEIDVAIIKLRNGVHLQRAIKLEDSESIPFGDEGFFLGFPYAFKTVDKNGLNFGFPFPLVKKATLSGQLNERGVNIMLLDGNNNPGFSGSPVIFIDRFSKEKKWIIAGVVNGYYPENKMASTPVGTFTYNENSGIISAIGIKHVKSIIDRN